MNCVDLRRYLQPLLEDRLRETEYQALHAHLADCAACRGYAGASGAFAFKLKEFADVEPPAGLADEVLAGLKVPPRLPEPRTQRQPRSSRVFIVAFILVVLPALFWGMPLLTAALFFK